MAIKIDQNKFHHYNPLTEITGSAVNEHRRGFDRLISGCVWPCATTMLYVLLLGLKT